MSQAAKNRNLFVILLLLGGAAIGIKMVKEGRYETGESVQAAEALFAELNIDQVSQLEINGPGEQAVTLAKAGEEWQVTSAGSYRADQTAVSDALDALRDLQQGKVVSQKTDQLSTYDLEGDEAIHVVARDSSGGELADIRIGKTSSDFRSFYLRVADEGAIRKVDNPIRAKFDKSSGGGKWRDMTVFDASTSSEDVRTLHVYREDQLALLIEKEDVMGPVDPAPEAAEGDAEAAPAEPEMEVKESVWNLAAPETGRAVKFQCDAMARALTDLKCDGFFDGEESLAELGLEPPRFKLVANQGEPTESVLWMGDKRDDNQYPIRKPDGDVVWLIQGWRGDNFTKEPKELLDPGSLPPEPEEELAEELPAAAGGDDADDGAGEDAAGEAPAAGASTEEPSDPAGEERP